MTTEVGDIIQDTRKQYLLTRAVQDQTFDVDLDSPGMQLSNTGSYLRIKIIAMKRSGKDREFVGAESGGGKIEG